MYLNQIFTTVRMVNFVFVRNKTKQQQQQQQQKRNFYVCIKHNVEKFHECETFSVIYFSLKSQNMNYKYRVGLTKISLTLHFSEKKNIISTSI